MSVAKFKKPSIIFISLFLVTFFNCYVAFENHYKVISHFSNHSHTILIAENLNSLSFFKKNDNPFIKFLEIKVIYQKSDEFRVSIRDLTNKRWEIPESEPFPHDNMNYEKIENEKLLYEVIVTDEPFSFKVKRKETGEIIFDTDQFNFIYSDRYIEFGSIIPSKNIFGIGERVHQLKLKFPGKYTIWNRDLPGVIDDGEDGAENTYGLHPVYLNREKSGRYHMVYLRNSNGMDILLNKRIIKQNDKFIKQKTIIYKIVGGIIDLKFFLGEDSIEKLIKNYHNYLGGYMLQPFWSFGFHQSRWGYLNLSMLNNTLYKYHSSGMPLDAIWMDIDYMINHNIFTIDEDRYNLTLLNNLLNKEYKKKLVLIIDPGVAVNKSYIPYIEGIKRDIFIENSDGSPLRSCVWPGLTHFPDFVNPKTQNYWSDMLDLLKEKVNFSGIWLDMNELSNFVDGQVSKGECGYTKKNFRIKKIKKIEKLLNKKSNFRYNKKTFEKISGIMKKFKVQPVFIKCNYTSPDFYYVYNPGNKKLDTKTICLNAKHYNNYTEYDFHNYNGFYEGILTNNYMKDRLKISQPFILTRSTASGSGKFVMHWTGDNVSTNRWMKLSIAGLINFNMFGVPNVGADICGFGGDTNEELCSRWMQLGSLYPFSRNHNSIDSIDQDPFSFGATLFHTSMVSLKFRYSILKYYYYLFVRNNGTGTIFRPLFFEFKEIENLKNKVLDHEFLIGSDLLVTPVLHHNTFIIEPYFPGVKSVWYEIHKGNTYVGGRKHFIENELNNTAPIFIRNGKSIFTQNVKNVNSTNDLDNVFNFNVGLKKINKEWFVADGEIMGCNDYLNYDNLKKCLNGNCLIKVNFKVNIDEIQDLKILSLSFESQGVIDLVWVSEIYLYGISDINFNMIDNIVTLKNNRIINQNYDGKLINKEKIKIVKFDDNLPIENGIQYIITFK